MNWQRGLKRLRIVSSVLGFLAGLIIFGIVSFQVFEISSIAKTLNYVQIELYHLEKAKIIAVSDSNQPIYRYESYAYLEPSTFVELDAKSYKQKLIDFQNSVNLHQRDLNHIWGIWLIMTIVGGFVSFLVVWFTLKILSWIILGFAEK